MTEMTLAELTAYVAYLHRIVRTLTAHSFAGMTQHGLPDDPAAWLAKARAASADAGEAAHD